MSKDEQITKEIKELLDRADRLEAEAKANPKPTISYGDLIRKRHAGTKCTCVYCTNEM